MKTSINFSGRKKINLENVELKINKNIIDLKYNLDYLNLDSEYKVKLKLNYGAFLQIFEFGTIGQRIEPENMKISKELAPFVESGSIKSNLIIVDNSEVIGKIVATTSNIEYFGTDENGQKIGRSLLGLIIDENLGDLPWKIETDEGSKVVLSINNKICENKQEFNGKLMSSILIGVLKEISFKILYEDKLDDEDGWAFDWKNFFKESLNSPLKNNIESVSDLINSFCEKNKIQQ